MAMAAGEALLMAHLPGDGVELAELAELAGESPSWLRDLAVNELAYFEIGASLEAPPS
jgi:hypothetical protein